MLRIREEQMDALAQRTKRRFVAMLERYLREHFAAWVAPLSGDALRVWLESALERAARHGVTTEPEAAQLILLFVLLGVAPDAKRPWIEETLSSRHLASVGKVKRLVALAREHGVEGIERVVVYEGMEA